MRAAATRSCLLPVGVLDFGRSIQRAAAVRKARSRNEAQMLISKLWREIGSILACSCVICMSDPLSVTSTMRCSSALLVVGAVIGRCPPAVADSDSEQSLLIPSPPAVADS